MKLSLWLDHQYTYLKKVGMFKNILVEVVVRLMSCGNNIIDMYAKSRMIIDDVCKVFHKMHAHTM
jgi:pentatricopeptide repeat protein